MPGLACRGGGEAVVKEDAGGWSDVVPGKEVQLCWPVHHSVLVEGCHEA